MSIPREFEPPARSTAEESLETRLSQVLSAFEELPAERVPEWRDAVWFLYLLISSRPTADEQKPLLSRVVEPARIHRWEVTDLTMTGTETDIAEARTQGREEGRVQMVLDILESRFGRLTESIRANVRAQPKAGLTQVARHAATASSLDEFLQQ